MFDQCALIVIFFGVASLACVLVTMLEAAAHHRTRLELSRLRRKGRCA